MNESAMKALAGTLRITPGQHRPHSLVSSRRDWAAMLGRDQPADVLGSRLASFYSLCGESHRICAKLAISAARGQTPADLTGVATALRLETLREHVRRIGLDWPAQLYSSDAGGAQPRQAMSRQAQALLRACPLLGGTSAAASAAAAPDLSGWLQTQVLGLPATTWLAHWEEAPQAWLRSWSAATPLHLPRLLHGARAWLDQPRAQAAFLRVHSSEIGLRALADAMQRDPAFTRQPLWRGHCAETGSWTRLRQCEPERINTPWLRLGSRLAELVRLSLPPTHTQCGTQWLSYGNLATARHAGLGWVEMARGLLIHHVQLDPTDARVLSCQVLAPTEWNFHPQGGVAEALEQLPRHANATVCRDIRGLLCAYDPCVQHELSPTSAPQSQEASHA